MKSLYLHKESNLIFECEEVTKNVFETNTKIYDLKKINNIVTGVVDTFRERALSGSDITEKQDVKTGDYILYSRYRNGRIYKIMPAEYFLKDFISLQTF